MRRLEEHENAYGQVREPVGVEFQGYRFVAVGDRLYRSKDWRTFFDFLLDYVKLMLTKEWSKAEFEKPEGQRHQIIDWHTHVCRFQRLGQKGPDGLYAMTLDGITTAFFLLSYDLYILGHHQKLQEIVLRRLKNREQFHGARYELLVAATVLRAGFQLRFEDETDCTQKHPELIATCPASGEKLAIEAKSRSRDGVLGQPGERTDIAGMKLGVRRKLNEAAKKPLATPLVVFLDLNVPDERLVDSGRWLTDVCRDVERMGTEWNGGCPFRLIVITNNPHHYGEFGKPEVRHLSYAIIAPSGATDDPLAKRLDRALAQYGNVPVFFDGDPRVRTL